MASFREGRTFGAPVLLACALLIGLMTVGTARHPASLAGPGASLLTRDVALVLVYGALSFWAWRQRRPGVRDALSAGARAGLVLAAVFIANHAIEFFAPPLGPTSDLARGAGSTLVMLALLGAAGSTGWARTHSVAGAGVAGLWCAGLAAPIGLGVAFAANDLFADQVAARLQAPFLASGLGDAAAFVTRNSLESASEVLVRLPVAAVALAVIGGLANAWVSRRSRTLAVAGAFLAPALLVGGMAALWHADALQRAHRPPFVMGGVMAAALALCTLHPIWSSLSRRDHRGRPAGPPLA